MGQQFLASDRMMTILASIEGMDDPNTSMFAGLGWNPKTCESLVSNDDIDDTLEQAVGNCSNKKVWIPWRNTVEYFIRWRELPLS